MGLRRRAQSRAVRAMRRSRFFPIGAVDRLGEDADYADRGLDARVLVFFPGPPDQLYQLLPWLPTLESLHVAHPLVIVCQDSRVRAAVRARSPLPVVAIARYGALDGILGRSDVGLALYVGHASANFECLRFASLLHVYIGHGDSDKGVSASNQLKAYDHFFAPGEAAVERVARRLMRFDATARGIVVGQPLAFSAPPVDPPAVAGPRTVLYAPTWEGAQPSVAYSSVRSHGAVLVRALLDDPRYRVVYRPHPLTGVTSGDYAGADRAIRDAVTAAGDVVVTADDESLEASFARAHLLVTDVSAVTTAWLPSLRPLVVTRTGGQAVSADSGLLDVVPRLDAGEAASVGDLLAAAAADEPARTVRALLVERYLSEYWPDRLEARFVEVVGRLLEERDSLRAELVAGGATGV